MQKELVVIYDTPALTPEHIRAIHNPEFYLQWFDKIHITHWARVGSDPTRAAEEGLTLLSFYGYEKKYSSGYLAGIRYMVWIAKTLWKIASSTPAGADLVFMPVIPIWAGIPALLIGKLRGKKVVLRLEAEKIAYMKEEDRTHNTSHIASMLKVWIIQAVYAMTMPFFDYVIGISRGAEQEAKAWGAKKTAWIPLYIDTAHFCPAKEKKQEEKLTVVSIGQIKKRKGFGELIEAVRLLEQEEGIRARLLIAGEVTNENDRSHLKEFQKMSTNMDIEFLGGVPHHKLVEMYNRASVFVLASYVETLGMVTMEAMACGVCVVATKTSGSKDLVQDGVTGFLVEQKSARAIQEKLAILLGDPVLRERMGKAGRKRMEELMGMVRQRNAALWQEITA